MVGFTRTVTSAEERTYYLNLTDNEGNKYGTQFPPDRTPLIIVTGGRHYRASKRGINQIWGALRIWYVQEKVSAGDTIRISYDPSAERIEGRAPIEITILEQGVPPTPAAEVSREDRGRLVAEQDEARAEVSVEMERELEEFLVQNLHLIEEGLELYTDETGRTGRQYQTDVGPVDFLCVSSNRGDFVLIELKKGRSSDAVVGQISRYIGWVKENLAEGKGVRGIIVVHDFDPRLKYAVLAHENLELKYYEIRINFTNEQRAIDRMEQ